MHDEREKEPGRRFRGMTLIELTASVACVALLLSMLVPALSEARREGKEVRCLSNLGQIADASAVYAAADRSELAIPVHPLIGSVESAVGTYEWGGKSGKGEPLGGNSPADSKWGTRIGRGPASRALNQVIYGDVLPDYANNRGPGSRNWFNDIQLDLDVFRCPADYGYTGYNFQAWKNSELSSFDHYGNSYAAGVLWAGVPGPGCTLASNAPFLRPLSRIPAPARTILYMENCGRFAWRVNYGGPDDGGCNSISGGLGVDVDSVIRGWHGLPFRFNVAFSDGHAAGVIMYGHDQPEPRLGRYPRWEDHYAPHGFWQCVIIRGPDWQVDTLPAPPVQTNLSCASAGVPVHGVG